MKSFDISMRKKLWFFHGFNIRNSLKGNYEKKGEKKKEEKKIKLFFSENQMLQLKKKKKSQIS